MVKEYNWIFTGKNQDILNFDATYKLQYFEIRNFQTKNKGVAATGQNIVGDRSTGDRVGRNADRTNGTNILAPTITVGETAQGSLIQNVRGSKYVAAAEFMDLKLNNPMGDMVNVDLEIIGDPDWVPQDRSVLPKGTAQESFASGYVDNNLNKGISTDVDSVYVKLKFRTPRDYNDKTGLMNISSDQDFVQGIYQVIKCTNKFVGGKFTQALEMVRVANQLENNSQVSAGTSGRSLTGSPPERQILTLPTTSNLQNPSLPTNSIRVGEPDQTRRTGRGGVTRNQPSDDDALPVKRFNNPPTGGRGGVNK